jgi:hypothetical protein
MTGAQPLAMGGAFDASAPRTLEGCASLSML